VNPLYPPPLDLEDCICEAEALLAHVLEENAPSELRLALSRLEEARLRIPRRLEALAQAEWLIEKCRTQDEQPTYSMNPNLARALECARAARTRLMEALALDEDGEER